MKHLKKENDLKYGISRMDDDRCGVHCWRVSLVRRGKKLVENFPDKKYGGRQKAFKLAVQFRDELLGRFPPISRLEVCKILRSNNTTGVSGVCTYAKRYKLRDGTTRENWYWEASWPTDQGKRASVNFSVKKYGEELARSMAIRARLRALENVEGPFWVSGRGLLEPRKARRTVKDSTRPIKRVA